MYLYLYKSGAMRIGAQDTFNPLHPMACIGR